MVALAQKIMAEASSVILGDKLVLRSDAKIIRYPERYVDERGEKMWETVRNILTELRAAEPTHEHQLPPRTDGPDLLYPRTPAQSPSLFPLENLYE